MREERERIGLKQEDLGQIGGVNRNTQGKYEKGERSPDAVYLTAIAAAGIDVLFLVTGERKPAQADGLTEEESKLVQRYRAMPPENRATVERVVEAMAIYLPGDVRG